MVEWRSGSAGALQAQGRGFKSLLDHQKNSRPELHRLWPVFVAAWGAGFLVGFVPEIGRFKPVTQPVTPGVNDRFVDARTEQQRGRRVPQLVNPATVTQPVTPGVNDRLRLIDPIGEALVLPARL